MKLKLIKVDRGWLLVTDDESRVICTVGKVEDFEALERLGIEVCRP